VGRRIPEEELEWLKREVSVERLAEARGVKLKRHGQDLIGLCPFHDDKNPSLVISPAKNLWHCLGACQAGGSVIDWVMKAEGVSFRHAVELLRADRPAPSGTDAKPVQQSTVTKLPPPIDFDAEEEELLLQVVDYYHETLKDSPNALKYLGDRGLMHPEVIERFQLGYANRTLGYRLPNKQRVAGAEIRGRLTKLGIYRETGHEHFNGCLVVPVFDEQGRVREIYGRKITRVLKQGIPLHLYLPGPHRGVWNSQALQESKEVILCEALLDALTFWCAGYRHVTAAYGIEGFTDEHLEVFRRSEVERVLIAYDRDDAGDRAAEKLAERLLAAGVGCYRVHFPRGMDANEYALKVEPAKKSLGLVLRNASWMGEGAPPAKPGAGLPAEAPPPAKPSEAEKPPAAKSKKAPEAAPPPAEPPSSPSLAAAPEPPLPATPAPPAPATPDVPTEIKPEEVVLHLGDRRYRVRGLAKNMSYDVLRVNLLASRGDGFHVDTLDLYSARQRAVYVKPAAEEMGVPEEVVRKDLGRVLLKLEELQEEQIRRALEPEEEPVLVSRGERREALELLEDPELLPRILEDFNRCGVVGEETNKLVGYLAAVSRKLEEPLAVIIQSSSAAGKSSLMEAILDLMPGEERVQYSAMTGQSLFYMGETDLAHKILAVVEEEGAERASYALKLLQSEGELTIASTGKDPQTGRLVTHEYRVEGPVATFLTTTAVDVDEELLNRCLVLTVNEDREQTRAIHRLQRQQQTLEGLLARQDREQVLRVHRNAQRLLQPLLVANPYARELTFLDVRTRARRDHVKYLTLIRAIALLHQYQRPIQTAEHRGRKVSYIEVTLEDIEVANRLAHEVLGRSLDELPPQTRRLLNLLDRMVADGCEAQGVERSDFRFTRRDLRRYTGWTDFQVKTHIRKLEELEYVLVHRGGRGEAKVYELLYDGQGEDDQPFLMGLIDVQKLRARGYDRNPEGSSGGSEGSDGGSEGSRSPQGAPKEPRGRVEETEAKPNSASGLEESEPEDAGNAHLEAAAGSSRSRSQQVLPLVARAAGGC
jgi:CHC2 zinc finger/Toprim-like/DNA primase catalytic core, N-terminal domain